MNNNPVVELHLSRDDVIILSNLAASKTELVRKVYEEHDYQGNEMLKQQDRDYLAQLARIFVYLDNRVVDSDVNKG